MALGVGGFNIIGENVVDGVGYSVSSAGDVNGDGFDDLIVGARNNDTGGINEAFAGAAYVVFGAASGITSVNLDDVALGIGGFKIIGEASNDYAGFSVSSAGDVNGDGFVDQIVGARFNNHGRHPLIAGGSGGAAYVVFGAASGINSVNLDDVALGNGGFRINGQIGDRVGRSVSSAGDVNGDGFDDLIVGAYFNDAAGFQAGAAYVVFGAASGIASINLANVALGVGGFKITAEAGQIGDRVGRSVSSAGDVNGDGFDDLIVGAYKNNAGGTNAGAAYVVFGAASGINSVNLDDVALGTGGFKITGENSANWAGFSVSSAGDMNGDGFDDVIVGAPVQISGDDLRYGAAYVVFGAASGITSVNLDDVALGIGGFKITGENVGDSAGGISVSSAGDVNGDGFDDLIVGATFNDAGGTKAGAAYVVFGATSGITSVNLDDVALGIGGFKIIGEATGYRAGYSVSSAGDVNGDGFADLIVGNDNIGLVGPTGSSAYVVFGFASVVSQLTAAADGPPAQLDETVTLLGVTLSDLNSGDVLI